MTFFESLLALLLAAVVLLQVARRLSLPYPAMLAAAGVVVALIPGTPTILLDPQTALALFIAPVLVDAAYDFSPHAAKRIWEPLVAVAVVAVLLTAAVVAWIGWAFAGLPIAAALALGAVVAPPDAAAATAVLGTVSIPRNSEALLRGESLFNDATALLLFGFALSLQAQGINAATGLQLALAAPGGILFGIACAMVVRRISRFVTGTLGGTLVQFVIAWLVWILAEHLHLSAVLTLVSFAMALAQTPGGVSSARMRVHSYAVWSSVVFVLNVVAFMLMGMQARVIVGRMKPETLDDALLFAGMVVVAVIVVRMVAVFGFNRLMAWQYRRQGRPEPASKRQAILVGWSGMRGLVTLATAFALPESFPQRDLIVLTAFAVVLATLVAQGLTLSPLIRLLGLNRLDAREEEMAALRARLAASALASLDGESGPEAEQIRAHYEAEHEAAVEPSSAGSLSRRRELGLAAVAARRRTLEEIRETVGVGQDDYILLQEELDWTELALLPEEQRRIEEN